MNLGLNYGGGSVASANQGLSPFNYGLGAAELALAGGINGLVDIGAGFASAVALPFVGLDRAVGVQQAISSVLGYELKTAGALDISNRLAFIGEGVEALRGISEERFGLGATAVGFGVVDAGVQIGTLLLGARPLLSAAKRGSGSEVATNSVDDIARTSESVTGAQWNEFLSSKYGAENVFWDWPKNKGFVYGADEIDSLQPGQLLGRLGSEKGTFVSPLGTSPETLSLRPGTDLSNLNVYRVTQEIPNTRIGPAAPAFDMPGYGPQFELSDSVRELLKSGHLERVIK